MRPPIHERTPVELRTLLPSTVFQYPETEQIGMVQRHSRKQGRVVIWMADQGTVLAPPDDRVIVLAEPWELAQAYVLRPALRAQVHGAVEAETRRVVEAIGARISGPAVPRHRRPIL